MPSKKIGIITISNGPANYGNLLQNYALQTVLSNLGCEVYSIQDGRNGKDSLHFLTHIKSFVHLISKIRYSPTHKKQIVCFIWKKKNIKTYKRHIKSPKDTAKIDSFFDIFVVGSDQIWNPYWFSHDELSFLRFASKKKRVAYAASFGVDTVSVDVLELLCDDISEFKAVSVRERVAADLIEHSSGKKVPVLLDPTMLLSTKQWDYIIKKKKLPTNKYVLAYFVGELTPEYYSYITQFVNSSSIQIIDLNSDAKFAGCDPGVFVGLIKNSYHIFTDSFHGCVFSLLYHKSFSIFERRGESSPMKCRIRELVDKFKINLSSDCDFIYETDVNWSAFDKVLSTERKKAFNYIANNVYD